MGGTSFGHTISGKRPLFSMLLHLLDEAMTASCCGASLTTLDFCIYTIPCGGSSIRQYILNTSFLRMSLLTVNAPSSCNAHVSCVSYELGPYAYLQCAGYVQSPKEPRAPHMTKAIISSLVQTPLILAAPKLLTSSSKCFHKTPPHVSILLLNSLISKSSSPPLHLLK